MAVVNPDWDYEIKDLKHALRTKDLELSLERSKHSVDIVAKDEDIRKLRVSQCLLRDENGDLHEQLEEEQARSDGLENELNEALAQLDEQAAAAELAQNQIRTQAREVANLKAELKAMENITSDSNKILSEKLALTREISSLRPEVEHLRAQVESNDGLLAEKLSLQRQLTTIQVELENEKRTSARALAKQGKKMEQDEDLRGQMEELRNELAKEKKDRFKAEAALAKAEKATEQAQADLESQEQVMERAQAKLDKAEKKEAQKANRRDEEREAEVEQLREELAREKSARAAAEKANAIVSERDAQLEELQQQLDQEKRERQKLEKANKKSQQGSQQSDGKAEDMKTELEEAKRERKQQEKEYTKTLSDLQNKNAILDDKLSAFREKLRSTKEKLKQKEEELERAERAQTAPPAKAVRETSVKPAKNVRKRMAASVEPETNLGTPGNGIPAKKTRRGISATAIGDTSNFSLTPFLNRTAISVPGETIIEEEDDEKASTDAAEEATSMAPPKKAAAPPKIKALVPSASNKANAKPGTRKKTSAPILDVVAEEASHLSTKDNSENLLPAVTVPLKTTDGPSKEPTKSKLVPKIKPRKSLMSFATFIDEPAAEKKKKRKLGAGGLGKTLFDDDEEADEDAPAKPKSSKGLFAARALGKAGLGKGIGRPISGGYNMMSDEGFTFSPLKKDRRAGGPGASFLK
ncbi:uncharacterized protein N0V89_010271 [Didymosphaeria variabile]|uniref:Uncharacterized protein n=1 Tax=Didymosphaeria variabile TaxID=1932322 RepID=A0A9W9C704_9PLEO|nr:uncharacterized protein N0V89_010271 [Didymosphaeria variabile]KAJ4346342.1 hypothetical protein N0V89_010271 [Didymosphaeria variabile]